MKIKFLNGEEREFDSLVRANFSQANLRDADLFGADLRRADLRRANLRDADLFGADLRRADLRRADLREAYLWNANLFGANLREADLREAYLRGADLRGVDLFGADLRGADLRRAIGNNKELQTIMLGTYVINIWQNVMQIGCERHLIDEWFGFDDSQIKDMDSDALEWWMKWKGVIKQIIEGRECKDDDKN